MGFSADAREFPSVGSSRRARSHYRSINVFPSVERDSTLPAGRVSSRSPGAAPSLSRHPERSEWSRRCHRYSILRSASQASAVGGNRQSKGNCIQVSIANITCTLNFYLYKRYASYRWAGPGRALASKFLRPSPRGKGDLSHALLVVTLSAANGLAAAIGIPLCRSASQASAVGGEKGGLGNPKGIVFLCPSQI